MSPSESKKNESPILNSPYEEPTAYYSTNEVGELDYTNVIEGRRLFAPVSPIMKRLLPETWEAKSDRQYE